VGRCVGSGVGTKADECWMASRVQTMASILLSYCRACYRRVSAKASRCPHCDEPNPAIGLSPVEFVEMVRSGRKVEAVRLFAERARCSLLEAKEFIDGMRL
jgi:hypothetical protein